jgi:argininosuccinate lyase
MIMLWKCDVYSEQEKDNLIKALNKLNSTYAKGGKTKVGRGNRSKTRNTMSVAREIRKDGETWRDALKRAGEMIRNEAK